MRYLFKNIFAFYAVLISAGFCKAQTPTLDSLKNALSNSKHDTSSCLILTAMIEAEEDSAIWPKYNERLMQISRKNLETGKLQEKLKQFYRYQFASSINNLAYRIDEQGNGKAAIEQYMKSLAIYEEEGDKNEIANVLMHIGFISSRIGNDLAALEHYKRCVNLWTEVGDKKSVAKILNNMSVIIENRGDIDQALNYCLQSLKISEEIKDNRRIIIALNNLGMFYDKQRDFEKALEYYNKCLKLMENSFEKDLAVILSNVGSVYENQNKDDLALDYYLRAAELLKNEGDRGSFANTISNIGGAYYRKREFGKALENYNKAYEIYKTDQDKKGTAQILSQIATLYIESKNFVQALSSANESMKLSIELGHPDVISIAAQKLWLIHKAKGNYSLSLENYELHIKMRDSLLNEKTRKASIKSQLKYEYEKQAAADSVAHAKESEIKNVQLDKQTAEIKAKKNQQYALVGGLALVIIFAAFMFNRFKITQKQKIIIEQQKEFVEAQKHIVEEKQKEVLDSIRYAKRIQTAHLPSEKKIENTFKRILRT